MAQDSRSGDTTIYLATKYEHGTWRTVRWFATLDTADRVLTNCGYSKDRGCSYMFTRTIDGKPEYVCITTARLES